jgi:3',5'-cyclic AMP phosphodiesterase CpdA
MGDVQTNPAQLERIVEHLHAEAEEAEDAGEPLLGVLLLGDVTEMSRLSEFQVVAEALRNMPVPTAVIPGNHDTFARERALYNRTFGPGNYTFDLCGTRVALLDSGSGGLADSIQGRFPELLARADDQDHLVVATHYPPYAGRTGAGWGREDQAHHLMVELAMQEADLVLSGHVHALHDYPRIPVGSTTVHAVIVGTAGADQGLGTARYGYLRISIADDIELCFVEVPPPGAAGPENGSISDSLPYCAD